MKLPRPFLKLPVRFDAERLRAEVEALPRAAWDGHPTDFAGNSVARLITVDGGENDEVAGAMRPTPHLLRSQYLQQVLSSFGVVWSRSRLMHLAPGSGVPEHADINYHWFYRVRVHIPVVTRPEVRFFCGDESVHMAAGECWVFDNWRRHRVENPTAHERVHLVADTTGSAGFWQLVAAGQDPQRAPTPIHYLPDRPAPLLCERYNSALVMPPSEVEMLLGDLRGELHFTGPTAAAGDAIARFGALLDSFCQEWRQLWCLHGDTLGGGRDYARLREMMRQTAAPLGAELVARTNQVPIGKVLEARVLRHLLNLPAESARASRPATVKSAAEPRLDRPLFIVAAPRSGSTLLFETLACSPQLWTLGGEAHWLVEGVPELQPGAPQVDSNRLTAEHVTPEVAGRIRAALAGALVNPQSQDWRDAAAIRLLEKTPKNALRVPFLHRLFPDALFLLLWRDPRENVSSIMEAWRDGGWVTYPALPGWDGPWSLLLPPGWRGLRGQPLEAVAAHQWRETNDTLLHDLAALPRRQWHALSHAELLADPAAAIRTICAFADLKFDAALQVRTAAALPPARYTLTAPAAGKWQTNREAIERVLPGLTPTWRALQALASGSVAEAVAERPDHVTVALRHQLP